MGKLPAEVPLELFGIKDDNDIIIECCNRNNTPDDKQYKDIMRNYIKQINSGLYKPTDDDRSIDTGDAEYMSSSCAFM